jgi:hypothetical protein
MVKLPFFKKSTQNAQIERIKATFLQRKNKPGDCGSTKLHTI